MKKKKTKLSSLFSAGANGLLALPLCYNAKTLSFRLGDDIIKTVNSVFFDNINPIEDLPEAQTPDSWFTNSSDTATHSTDSDSESLELVVRGVVRSERLFFDPGVTSSILDEKSKESDYDSKLNYDSKLDYDLKSKVGEDRDCIYTPPIEEISVAVAMESEDPYGDFRQSMEEMVRSHRELSKDWQSLESMLAWYLKMNGRRSHGVIVSAFVDLLSGLSDSGETSASVSDSSCYSTAVSSLPSSPLYSSSRGQTEIEEEVRRKC